MEFLRREKERRERKDLGEVMDERIYRRRIIFV